MSENESPPENQPAPDPSPDQQSDQEKPLSADGYVSFLMHNIKNPDGFFDNQYRKFKLFGMIHIGALFGLIALSSWFQRIGSLGSRGWRFEFLLNGIKFGLSFLIPLIIALFVLKWYSEKSGEGKSLEFFIEKLGGALTAACALIVIALPLALLDITIHNWFRGAGLVFIYLAIFLTSYLYAAPRKLQVAALFTLGYYFAYRLIWLLM